MKVDSTFPRQVGVTLFISALIGAYPLLSFGSAEIAKAVLLGSLLSTGNVLLGYLTVEYSYERSSSVFLKAVLGGMGVRMLLMLGALFVLIRVYEVHAIALTFSLFGFYVVFLVLEVLFIQKKFTVRN